MNDHDICTYIFKRSEKIILFLVLYVNDILMTNSKTNEIDKVKEALNGEFYLQKLVEKFRMFDAKIINTPLGYQTKILIMQCNYNKDEKRRWRILSM